MEPATRPDSIFDRIDRALAEASQTGRTPVSIVVGKDDGPTFRTSGSVAGELVRFRELPVRLSESSFLSRLEFRPVPGLPNAVLL